MDTLSTCNAQDCLLVVGIYFNFFRYSFGINIGVHCFVVTFFHINARLSIDIFGQRVNINGTSYYLLFNVVLGGCSYRIYLLNGSLSYVVGSFSSYGIHVHHFGFGAYVSVGAFVSVAYVSATSG